MSERVATSYDEVAALYASLFLDDLEHDEYAQAWLARFADAATDGRGPVADLGCGPGHVVDHLARLGLTVSGVDLSPGQIAEARRAFPDSTFQVGDLTRLATADDSLGGIVSRYSIIHIQPDDLPDVFTEWKRALEPGAPLLVSFFGSLTDDAHGTPFDHRVATAHELFPSTVGGLLSDAGFVDIATDTHPPAPGGRPFTQTTVFAAAPA